MNVPARPEPRRSLFFAAALLPAPAAAAVQHRAGEHPDREDAEVDQGGRGADLFLRGDREGEVDRVRVVHAHVEHDKEKDQESDGFEDSLEAHGKGEARERIGDGRWSQAVGSPPVLRKRKAADAPGPFGSLAQSRRNAEIRAFRSGVRCRGVPRGRPAFLIGDANGRPQGTPLHSEEESKPADS